MEHSNRGSVSRKIISKIEQKQIKIKMLVTVDQQSSTTDFDDLASQLSSF